MNYVKPKVFDITKKRPAVLLVGNGLNRCMGDDTTWDNAILKLAKDDAILDKIKRLDYSIRATVTADEDNQKRWSRYVKLFDNDFKYFDNPLLKNLLRVPFDAVLTTNYTYELENALDENFPRSDHKEDWVCTTAANIAIGKQPDSVRLLNTFNRLKNEDGKDVDIWHIHGEVRDPASMILTHEEYGKLVTELVREEENEQNEGEILFDSWQDYFVYGDLYILGQGVNFAEFDLWWMLSRRRREKAGHGRTIYYAPRQSNKCLSDVEEALDQIGLKIDNCGVVLPQKDTKTPDEMNRIFRDFYYKAADRIRNKIEHPLPLDTELLIEYREKAAMSGTKTNKLRLMYQLSTTKVYTPGIIDSSGKFWPHLYAYRGENPSILMLFSIKEGFPGKQKFLHEITGLEALDIATQTPGVRVIILDPYTQYGHISLPLTQAVYMKKDPEWLKKQVEEADEKDLARRKNNVNAASEATHYVSSFISNCTFANSLEEVWSDMDGQGYFNYEMMLHSEEVQWTSPKWAKPGDIVFFAHAQNCKGKITKLKSELKARKGDISEDRYNRTEKELDRVLSNFEKYGRKIFAIGQVVEETENIAYDDPFYEDPSLYHFKSNNFSCITNVFELKHPVSMDEYKSFIAINMFGSITPVYGEKFTQLQKLIIEKNADMENIPYYFSKSTASPLALVDLNEKNWMQLDSGYRKQFSSKNQYQSYYTDYLLKAIGDIKKIGLRCRYSRVDKDDAFMDNVITFGKRFLPVKIFIDIPENSDAIEILERYCHATEIMLTDGKIVQPPKIYSDNVLVIDRENLSIYDSKTQSIHQLQNLNDLKTAEDVSVLKEKLTAVLSGAEDTDGLAEENNAAISAEPENIPDVPEESPSQESYSSEENLPGDDAVSEEHENVDGFAGDPYHGILYVPVDVPVTPIGWAEYCLPSNKAEIARRAVMIVENEGVILRDKLMEKLRSSFGVKASEKVTEATEKALKAAKIKTTKVKGITHCWASAIDPKTYTSFRYHDEAKRRDDDLPLPELRNAVVRTLMDNGPLDENDLLVQTARTFGYQRLGPNLRNRLLEGIACAVSDKLIRFSKQKKYELREA